MEKDKIRRLLDFIPLVILIGYGIFLVDALVTEDFICSWRNVVILVLLPVNMILFCWRHRYGVLGTGVILLLGLFGMLSYTPGLTGTSITLAPGDVALRIQFSPVYILWLALHIFLSGRYYVGILTKNYWTGINREGR